MNKVTNSIKVGVVGKVDGQEELANFAKIVDIVSAMPDVEIVSKADEVNDLMDSAELGLHSKLFDLTVEGIEECDFLLMVEPLAWGKDAGIGFLYWMMGYAWSQGIPTSLVSHLSGTDIYASVVTSSTIQAHFTSIEELETYSFTEQEYIPFKGKVVY